MPRRDQQGSQEGLAAVETTDEHQSQPCKPTEKWRRAADLLRPARKKQSLYVSYRIPSAGKPKMRITLNDLEPLVTPGSTMDQLLGVLESATALGTTTAMGIGPNGAGVAYVLQVWPGSM